MTIAQTLIICSLRNLPAVLEVHDPEAVVSFADKGSLSSLETERRSHLRLDYVDVLESRGRLRAPDHDDIEAILDVTDTWTGQRPIVCQCYAGRSRSWAAALILAAYLTTEAPMSIVDRMNRLAPWATPHTGMLELADPAMHTATSQRRSRSGRPAPKTPKRKPQP